MRSADDALDRAEVDRLFARLARLSGVALAVSGGPDSTALMILAAEWAARTSPPFTPLVLTVDHRLRPEAAVEAAAVARRAVELGLPAEVLIWQGPKPVANIQDVARRERYRLLVAAALRHGAEALVTAHTLDDQAETVLIHLARGSGVTGLAAMPTERPFGPVTLVRPFLEVPKSRLVASLAMRGESYATDPSNADERYRRVVARRVLPELAALGLDAPGLAATAARMRRAAAALERAVDRLLETCGLVHAGGFARLSLGAYRAEAEEIRLRTLTRLIGHAGALDHSPRLERLERLDGRLAGGDPEQFRATLGGAVIEIRAGVVWFSRETGRAGAPRLDLPPGGCGLYDGRFRISVANDALAPVEIGPLGRVAAREFSGGRWPTFALDHVPAVRAGGTVVAVPALDIAAAGWVGMVRCKRVPVGLGWLYGDGIAGSPRAAADGGTPAANERPDGRVTIPSEDSGRKGGSAWLSGTADLF